MNLFLRILTAVLLLPGVLWLVWLGHSPLFALISVATVLILFEYFRMWAGRDWIMVITGIVLGFFPALVSMLWPQHLGEAIVACMLITVLGFTLNPGPLETTWKRMATTILGLVYCGVGLTFLYRLRQSSDASGAGWVFLVLAVTWANDTCAYFAGRLLGTHKLYELLSPKKTWEGAAGGLAGSIAAAVIAHLSFLPSLSLVEAIVIGFTAGTLAPVGDLAESLLKRSFDAKDSGGILPGHGGLLDRVDAMLFTAPYIYLFMIFAHPLFS